LSGLRMSIFPPRANYPGLAVCPMLSLCRLPTRTDRPTIPTGGLAGSGRQCQQSVLLKCLNPQIRHFCQVRKFPLSFYFPCVNYPLETPEVPVPPYPPASINSNFSFFQGRGLSFGPSCGTFGG